MDKNVIDNLLKTEKGRQISEKRNDIEKLINSKDGQQVKKMIENSDITGAFERSDTKAMENSLRQILNTKEGASLLSQISDLFK